MADQQDNHSLDSLFRSSFEGLNETPAPNGWDTPSDRVWQQVHSQIQTPASGFSVGKGILIATIILAIVLAYFGAFGIATPSAPDQHPAVTPIEAQHTPSVESPNAATPQPVDADEPQVTKSKPVNPAKNPNVKEPVDVNSTKPVNSTPTAPPNSTEKQKQKAQQ